MKNEKDIRFFPIFLGATVGVILEIVATIVDEVITGHLFADGAFAAVNLVEPLMFFEIFLAYLVAVGGGRRLLSGHGVPVTVKKWARCSARH